MSEHLNVSDEFVTTLNYQVHMSRAEWIIEEGAECETSDDHRNSVLYLKRNDSSSYFTCTNITGQKFWNILVSSVEM